MHGTILEKINEVPSARPAGTKQAAAHPALPKEGLSDDPWCVPLSILLSCFSAAAFCLLIYRNTLHLACLFLKRWLLMTAKITRGWFFFFLSS